MLTNTSGPSPETKPVHNDQDTRWTKRLSIPTSNKRLLIPEKSPDYFWGTSSPQFIMHRGLPRYKIGWEANLITQFSLESKFKSEWSYTSVPIRLYVLFIYP